MYLSFKLSMPGRNSWDGNWSGSEFPNTIVRNVGWSAINKKRVKYLLDRSPFFYSWDDGWRASVTIKEVDKKKARKIRRMDSNFSGYKWMVDSILKYGEILASHEECKDETLKERLEE